MELLILVIGLMFATVIVVGIGERTHLPWPILLSLFTGALILIPTAPEMHIEPEIILPIFLPPLLWALARKTSWGMFAARWRTILGYSVLLVIVTIIAAAWTVTALIPGIALSAAIAIGAAVAPPDPVAVEAVAEPVGMPRRIVGMLQTEGLFNDAVALVAFQTALLATSSGSELAFGELTLKFFYTAFAAVLIGLVAGWFGALVSSWLNDSVSRNAISLVIPFAVYIGAELIHASGVIAVVIAAVQMSSSIGSATPEDRITSSAFWDVLELLMTGLAFGLIGIELRGIIDNAGSRLGEMFLHGMVVALVVIAVRSVWMIVAWRVNKVRSTPATPRGGREALVLAWSGMRGLVTLALALSVPFDFPHRAEFTVIAVTVLLFTMVLPGLTLPLLMKKLRVEDAHDEAATRRLLARAKKAALDSLKQSSSEVSPEILKSLKLRYRATAAMSTEFETLSPEEQEKLAIRRRELRRVEDRAMHAAVDELLKARGERGTDPHVADMILGEVDKLMLGSEVKVSVRELRPLTPLFKETPPAP